MGSLLLRMPVIKTLIINVNSAKLSRTLSTLIVAGVPLIEALEITGNTMTNAQFKKAILKTREEVSMGSTLQEPIRNSALFPPLVSHMIGIGEETGALESMLDKMADYYDQDVETATDQMMALLEPLVIIALALGVGFVIAAMMMPMASIFSGLEAL